MKLAMKLTLDGMVRALRSTVHDLAEETERGYRPEREAADRRPSGTIPAGEREGLHDDRPRN